MIVCLLTYLKKYILCNNFFPYRHPRLVRGSRDTKKTEFVAQDPRTRRG